MTTGNKQQQQFNKQWDKAINAYRDDSKQITQFCNSTTDQLATILVTAALAFLAIISASTGSPEQLSILTLCQKIMVTVAICSFVTSAISGVIALLCEFQHLHNAHVEIGRIINDFSSCRSEKDIQSIQGEAKISRESNKNAGFSWVVFQAVAFICGTVLVAIYTISIIIA